MQPGAHLGRHTIVGLIGRGGLGAVYRATDSSLGRVVALKVLPPDVATDPDRLERFRREARALAALNHPNIVTIYSVEQDGDTHFLTMELVNGNPLDAVITPAAAARARADDRPGGHRPSCRRARQGHHPPRPEAGQYRPERQRCDERARLRTVEDARGRGHARPLDGMETQAGTIVGTPAKAIVWR